MTTENNDWMNDYLLDGIGAFALCAISVSLNFANVNINPVMADKWLQVMLHSIQILAGVGSLILVAHGLYLRFWKKEGK